MFRFRFSFTAFSVFLLFITAPTARADVQAIREAVAPGPQANAAAGIQASVDAFRMALGDPNNGNVVGSQASGRRHVTWDGGDSTSAPALLPGDFFNAIAPRGIIVSAPEARGQFQVSADGVGNNPTNTPQEFGNINAQYPTAFSAFSSPRLFANLSSNIMEVRFVEPGSGTPAAVSGFGAIFTDVDLSNSSKIEFFDSNGTLLFERAMLASPGNESLSFLGVVFEKAELAKVRLTVGDGPSLGPNDISQGGTSDIVVVDDFIYGEPTVVVPPAPIISGPSIATSPLVTFSGVAEPGSEVELFSAGDSVGKGPVSPTGAWEINSAIAFTNGGHTVTAIASNSVGASPSSEELSLTVSFQKDDEESGNKEGGNNDNEAEGKPSFDPTVITALAKPRVSKVKREVTLEMEPSDPTAAYFVRSICKRGKRKIASSFIATSNVTTFKAAKGIKSCKYSYSIVANGAESVESPKGK